MSYCLNKGLVIRLSPMFSLRKYMPLGRAETSTWLLPDSKVRVRINFPEFENTQKLIKVDVKSIDIGLKLLASKRIDTLAGFEELLNEIAESHPNWLRILKYGAYHPSATMQSYTAFSRESPRYHLKAPMEKALQALTDAGEIKRLKQKWIKTIKEK